MTNDNEVLIIQGDDFKEQVDFSGSAKDEVVSFKFTSNDLNYCKHITERDTDGKWYITIPHSDTIYFESGQYSYDLTVEFGDGTIFTPIHNASLIIKRKENKCND